MSMKILSWQSGMTGALMVFALFGVVHSVDAIGVSPPSIEAPQVLRGVGQKAKINIARLPSEVGDLTLQVSARGEFASYLLFEPTFIIPAAQTRADYIVTIDGLTAPVGTYQVPMTFSLISSGAAKESASGMAAMEVITGATIMVNFTVTGDQVVLYSINGMNVSNVESDDNVFAAIDITNSGNVDWKPESIGFTFTNVEDSTVVVTQTVSGDVLTSVKPGESVAQQIPVDVQLLEGSYTAHADISYGGVVVASVDSQGFSVVAPGTLKQSGELLGKSRSRTVFDSGDKIPVEGAFVNTGEVPLEGIFTVEVLHDGVYEDLVVGEVFVLDAGETADVSVFASPKETGGYTFKSYVKFANRKSNVLEESVQIAGSDSIKALAFLNTPFGLGIIGLVILVSVIGMVLVRKHRKKNTPASSASVQAAAVIAPPPVAEVKSMPQQAVVAPPPESTSKTQPPQSGTSTRRW